MTVRQLNVPSVSGNDIASLVRWARQVSIVVNETIRRTASTGAFFVWDEGCTNIPQNTNIDGAEELIFESPFSGNGTLILTVVGASGNVNVALNGSNLGTLSDPDTSSEILYEVQVTNLIDGLNSFKIWSTSTDGDELRRLEAWRNFTREQIDTAGTTADWGSVTGSGKPDDNADVTQDHAAEVVIAASSLPASPKAGWLVYLTSADGGFSADTWVRRNDANDAWVQVGAHDALQLINAAAEAGADQTAPRLGSGLLTDGGFESGTTSHWEKGDGADSFDITSTASVVRSGNSAASVFLAQNASGVLIRQEVSLPEEGDRLLVVGNARRGSTFTPNRDVFLFARFVDSSGSLVDSRAIGESFTTESGYQTERDVIEIPSGAVRVRIQWEKESPHNTDEDGQWFFDDIQVWPVLRDGDIDALGTTNSPEEADANVTEDRRSLSDWGDTQTFTPNWSNGFSTDPTGDLSYAISEDGRWARMWASDDRLGTADSAAMSLDNLPAAIRPSGGGSIWATGFGAILSDSEAVPVVARIFGTTSGSAGLCEFGSIQASGSGGTVQFAVPALATSGSKGLRRGATLQWAL